MKNVPNLMHNNVRFRSWQIWIFWRKYYKLFLAIYRDIIKILGRYIDTKNVEPMRPLMLTSTYLFNNPESHSHFNIHPHVTFYDHSANQTSKLLWLQ